MCGRDAALLPRLLDSVFQIMRLEIVSLHYWHKPWRVGEQIVHLLERALRSLRHERPEEQCIREVADLLHVSYQLRESFQSLTQNRKYHR